MNAVCSLISCAIPGQCPLFPFLVSFLFGHDRCIIPGICYPNWYITLAMLLFKALGRVPVFFSFQFGSTVLEIIEWSYFVLSQQNEKDLSNNLNR